MFKLSFILLILTTPFFSSKIYYGIPFWAYISLFITVIYAFTLIYTIEKKWKNLQKDLHE